MSARGGFVDSDLLHKVLYLRPLNEVKLPADFPTAVWAWIGMMVTFHSLSLLLEICDRKKWLVRFRRCKAGDNVPYSEILPRVLFNQVVLMLPMMWLSQKVGFAFQSKTLFNSVTSFVACMAIMGIGHDVMFYFGHRYLLHSKWGYKRLGHDIHHSTKANCALSAMYMASVDFALEILVPYLVPLWVMGNEACALFLLIAPSLGAVGGLYEHSGYNFIPRVPSFSTTAHYNHHSLGFVSFSDGFGSPGLMDTLMETTYEHYAKRVEDEKRQLDR